MTITSSDLAELGVPAAVCWMFAAGFIAVWSGRRAHAYLLRVAAAFALLPFAVATQALQWPGADGESNAVFAAAIDLVCVVLVISALAGRAGSTLDRRLLILAAGVQLLLTYFALVEPSTIARVYVLNLGVAALMLAALPRLAALRGGARVDRLLFWLFAAAPFVSIVRTLVLAPLTRAQDPATLIGGPFWVITALTLLVFVLALALALLGSVVTEDLQRLTRERDTDELTRLYNRRRFEELGGVQLDRANVRPVSLVLWDVDRFKLVNDTYGHPGGDQVLRQCGRIIEACTRSTDVCARYGGEEFILLLPGTPADGAVRIAERIRGMLEEAEFPELGGLHVTASFGVAELDEDETLDALIGRADRLLYAAKANGRNRIEVEVAVAA